MVSRASAAGVALSVAGLVLMLPAAAHAVPPQCPGASLVTAVSTPLSLPAPSCTNTTGPGTLVVPPGGGPAHGTITPGSPNVYTPTAGYHGRDQFKYQLNDPGNGLSNEATVMILVDTAPTCSDSSATTQVGVPLRVRNFPCGDRDPEDQDIFDVIVDDGANGIVTIDPITNDVIYTPNPGFAGTDSFPYWAEDQFGLESAPHSRMTVTVTNPVVATPVATPIATPIPAPKDLSAPSVTLKNASKKQALAVRVTTNENASATLTVALDKATAKKLKLSRTAGTLKTSLKAGTSTLKIKLSSKAAKAFKKQ
jgi:hypothetical protein